MLGPNVIYSAESGFIDRAGHERTPLHLRGSGRQSTCRDSRAFKHAAGHVAVTPGQGRDDIPLGG